MDQIIANIKYHIPISIKSWVKNPLNILIDPYTSSKPESWTSLIQRTFRYRAAGLGIGITRNEKLLLSFRDKHRGQRVFIMGNGPSLNLCDLSLLKNEVTFGVNSIFLNRTSMGFDPTYYVVEDFLVAEDRAEQINQYSGPIKFFGNYLNYCLKSNENTIWVNVCYLYNDYYGFPHFTHNAARILWVGGTVSYLCLQLAFYMGFSEIYLIGFDHNYKIPDDAKKNNRSNEILSQSDDHNHFHPDYFGKGYRWHDPQVDRMEKAYRKAKEAFEMDGRVIFNATIGGKLEVFKRVDYQSLFQG